MPLTVEEAREARLEAALVTNTAFARYMVTMTPAAHDAYQAAYYAERSAHFAVLAAIERRTQETIAGYMRDFAERLAADDAATRSRP